MAASTQTGDPAEHAVDRVLLDAMERRASDVHFEPTADGFALRWRVDGLLQPLRCIDAATGRRYVGRLMVAAQLLTYRQDIPQEGRLTLTLPEGQAMDLRLSVMPTTHGLRAVVRLPAELVQPRTLDQLGLPPSAMAALRHFAAGDGGMLVLCGPAGSGKTTAIYALLEHIAAGQPGLSLISLEDPVERDLPGVTQIEVTPFGELTYARTLRSILRQDPQVLALGEVRDQETGRIAVQAALSGHRLITTLHAGSPQGAILRLIEMGIEPCQLNSALFGVMAMRLLRRRDESGGYRGRVPLAEFARMDAPLRRAVLAGGDAGTLRQTIAAQSGFIAFADLAQTLVSQGVTDHEEVQRVLGGSVD